MTIIKIFGAYPWQAETESASHGNEVAYKRNAFSHNAIKTIIDRVESRVKANLEKTNPNIQFGIFYSRLRATSGSFVLESIRHRMSNAYAVIFDITGFNKNVMLELGMALELQQHVPNPAKVFLISCAEKFDTSLLPSDLHGYFLSCYHIEEKNNAVTFKDGNSLVMRITSDILEMLEQPYREEPNHDTSSDA
jgi:hypothetical protein